MDSKIVIGIPAFNEEKNIGPIILQLKKITDNVIVCDDGSTDLTPELAERLGATVVKHDKNRGYGAAILSLFKSACDVNADVFVTFDADGQHRVSDIESVIKPIQENKADVVIGSRLLKKGSNMPGYRKFGIKAITSFTNVVSGSDVKDSQSGFRAYNKKALASITPSEQGMGVSTEILIIATRNKLKMVEVPIEVSYGEDTSTHNPVSHGTSVILSTIRFIAIKRPLTFYGIPGLIFLAVGLGFISWTLQIYAEEGQIVTNVALLGIGFAITGVLLLITVTILNSMIILLREKNT